MKRYIMLALPAALAVLFNPAQALDVPAGRYQIKPLLSNKCLDTTGTTQLKQQECSDTNTSQQFDISATSGGYFKIVNVGNAKALDVSGSSTADGAQVVSYTWGGGNNEQFFFQKNGQGYVIQPRHSGKCIEIKDWSGDAGGLLQQMSCAGGSNQAFVLKPIGTESGPIANGRYKITAKHSGKCLDLPNSSLSNGTQLQQYSCNGTGAQQFDVYYVGGSKYEIRNVTSGKCIEANNGWTGNGTNIQQWDCNQTNAQRWYLSGTGETDGNLQFKSALDSGKVWDVTGGSTSNGAGIQLWSNTGVNQQKWYLEPVVYSASVAEKTYTMVNVNSNKCLNVPGSSTSNGTQLQQYSCNGTNAQKFDVQYVGDGYYKIVNVNSGLALHIANYSSADNTAVQQYEQHSGDNQLFTFVAYGAGYLIKPKSSYKCFDIRGASTADNALLQQYSCNQNNNQVFKLQ